MNKYILLVGLLTTSSGCLFPDAPFNIELMDLGLKQAVDQAIEAIEFDTCNLFEYNNPEWNTLTVEHWDQADDLRRELFGVPFSDINPQNWGHTSEERTLPCKRGLYFGFGVVIPPPRCLNLKITVHELMHALGFGHDEIKGSIMNETIGFQDWILEVHRESIRERYCNG